MNAGDELELRLESFKKACRDAGVKLTRQRLEIFRQVARSLDHPDAEAIYRGVRRRLPTVSLDTIYRNLWLLVDLGLISTLGPHRDRIRFDANVSPHHHFVCRKCGKTSDFHDDGFTNLEVPRAAKDLGKVEAVQVELRGLCLGCTDKK